MTLAKYKIKYQNGETNVIVADEEFAKQYAEENGASFELVSDQDIQDTSIPDMTEQVQAAMMAFAATSTEIPDNYALDMPDLFPTWERVLATGKPLKGGTILNDGGQLYRVNHDNTTPQEHQPPHGEGMTAVYTPINKTNSGTAEDPIPAVRGMEYVYGLIYKDPEDGKLYLCTRTGYNPGETVVLQYLPHELVEQYFEVYTG